MRQSRRPFLFVTRFTIVIVVCSLIVLFLYNRSDKGEDHIPHALIEIAPRLKHDARPVPQEPERVVDINGVTLKEIKRYKKPEDHPNPSIGSLQYRDQQFCTTYASRYEPYEDVNLSGSTYLNTYPRYKNDDGEDVDWTEKRLREDMLDAELLRLNHAAKPGKFIDWGSEIEQRRRKEDYQADRAFIIRVSENYTWGRDDISNVRALIAELALRPPKVHSRDVFLMVDVWTKNVSFTMSDRQRERILATSVPREFWSIAHLTSEEQRAALYPGLVMSGKLLNHQSPVNAYRSCFMPLQIFSRQHRQYEYIWTWELDVRSTADYGDILDEVEEYTRRDSLDDRLLTRQQHWHVGSAKGVQNGMSDDQEADLITLSPIFDEVEHSGWYWAYDFQNMPKDTLKRASIGRNVRFSRRLLDAMNEANVERKVSAHCESFPATELVYRQSHLHKSSDQRWKGVYVPHPIYTRHDWPLERLAEHINHDKIYKGTHRLRDLSFNYQSTFARQMYNKWRSDAANVCWAPTLLYDVIRTL